MAKRGDKTTAFAIAMVLMFATTAALISIPSVKAKTTFRMDAYLTPYIGVNGQTVIFWIPTPNFFMTDPSYDSSMGGSVWSNATVTFTRPDNTSYVVNGPITLRARTIGGVAARLQTIFTPDVTGNWTVELYWPGDDTYNAVTSTAYFTVGPHFERREVWAYISIRPYPVVGLGQDILINAWLTPPPPIHEANYQGYVFTFKRPDGTSYTVGPMDSEGPAVVWFNLPLDQLGNWSITMDFPGDWLSLPASVTRYITVQDEWVPTYPDTPLPTEPWTLPINVENREWRTIAGPWYMSQYNASVGAWNPYTEAPMTAHVLWKLPAYSGIGGYIGSPAGIQSGRGNIEYGGETTGIYAASVPTIRTVMAGRAYYTGGGMIHCVDIRTGEELWSAEGSFNVGATRSNLPVLYGFGSNFTAYDALTGAKTLDVPAPLSGMTFFIDPIVYHGSNGRLIAWTTVGSSSNAESRIVWNITDPGYHPQSGGGSFGRYSFSAIQNGVWYSLDTAGPDPYVGLNNGDKYSIGINITTGEIMYQKKLSDPSNPFTWMYRQGPMAGSGYGLWYQAMIPNQNEGRGWVAIDVATGNVAWTSEITDYPWGNFWSYMPEACGNGVIVATGYSGVYAFNATNGKIVWHYIDNDVYNEEPYESNIVGSDAYPNNLNLSAGDTYASYSFGSTGPVMGGNVIYAPNTEHSPTFYYRGQGLNAIDSTTGEGIWRILGAWTPTAVAYGTLLASNSPNGYTYAFAKGETATTVAASSKVIAKGDSVLLEGTVLDMSPAQPGTAAVSDADQEAWMEYLHMQQPYPFSAQGVSVSLDALDPNNNFVHIGDTTTDLTGAYSLGFTPDIEGKYTIVASFYNTGAYYGSTAETAMLVTNAPETNAPSSNISVQAPDYTLPIVGTGVAMIIAVAVATLLLLRKRP
jgi:outer membrane protein assembly factor BamB